MKTLKSIMLGIALLTVCFVAKATPRPDKNLTGDETIDTYLNAVVHGKLAGLDNAIDDAAQFNMIRGENVNTLDKDQLINSLKASENVEQDCKCTKSVMSSDDDTFVVKVEMKYADFTRTDVIKTQRSGKDWKITKVDTSFK